MFTLGSALRWLGHECVGRRRCSRSLDAEPVSVWFVLDEGPNPLVAYEARVVVDGPTGVTAGQLNRIITEINDCTQSEAIVVGSLSQAPRGTANQPSIYPDSMTDGASDSPELDSVDITTYPSRGSHP